MSFFFPLTDSTLEAKWKQVPRNKKEFVFPANIFQNKGRRWTGDDGGGG